MKKLVIAVLAASALVVAGCSDSDTQSTTDSATQAADNAADAIGSAASKAADSAGDAAGDARDSGFIAILAATGLKFGDDKGMVDEAKNVCEGLKGGKTAAEAAAAVKGEYNDDQNKALDFVRSAVPVYCATEVGKLIG